MTNKSGEHFHANCFACGQENVLGLQMKFDYGPEGCRCTVMIPSFFQSYDGVVHGGIVATMLDAAMVHCLRQQGGGTPLTCRLETRYFHAVRPGEHLTIQARLVGKRRKIFLAKAELLYANTCYARAQGAFTFGEENRSRQSWR